MDSSGYLGLLILVVAYSALCIQGSQTQSLQDEDPLNQEGEMEKTWDSDKFNEEADQTYNLIFHKYNNRLRPPELYVLVDLSVTLTHIRHLDVNKQELQTVLDLELNWVDPRLTWKAYKVNEIHESTEKVWCPDLVYMNGIAPVQQLYPKIVRIIHNGSVSWIRKEIVTTRCETQPSSRNQTCAIKMGFVLNNAKESDQNKFFFSSDSTASVASDADVFSHKWRLSSMEMNAGDENETKSTEIDLELAFENTRGDNAFTVSRGVKGDTTHTTDNYNVVNTGGTASGREDSGCGGCPGGGDGSIHVRGLSASVWPSFLGLLLVGFLNGRILSTAR